MNKRLNTTFFKTGNECTGITSRGYVFKFDVDDYEKVSMWSWSVDPRGYLAATVNKKHMTLHTLIMDTPKGYVIDHINGDKLDNRKSNLRICTQHQNSMNTKETKNRKLPKGISLTKHGRYRARIMFNRKEIRLGNFIKLDDAIEARKKAELKYFGEFARIQG